MRIEVEIGLQMIIAELRKLPELSIDYDPDYDSDYKMYDLMVEVCDLFTECQSKGSNDYIAKFSGEDDAFYIHLDYLAEPCREAYGKIFSIWWEKFLPTINFSSLLEKHSIVDNSKNIDYLYEPECELRREV